MTHSCAQNFELSPAPSPYDYVVQMASPGINLPGLMDRAEQLNVPFDAAGYNAARACYANPCGLPQWPAPKMLPVMDRTQDLYDVQQPYVTSGDVNTYKDNLTGVVTTEPWVPDPANLVNLQANLEAQQAAQAYAAMQAQAAYAHANQPAYAPSLPNLPNLPSSSSDFATDPPPDNPKDCKKPKNNQAIIIGSVLGGLAIVILAFLILSRIF